MSTLDRTRLPRRKRRFQKLRIPRKVKPQRTRVVQVILPLRLSRDAARPANNTHQQPHHTTPTSKNPSLILTTPTQPPPHPPTAAYPNDPENMYTHQNASPPSTRPARGQSYTTVIPSIVQGIPRTLAGNIIYVYELSGGFYGTVRSIQ